MHAPTGADDGIDRAGPNAFGAADAEIGFDPGDGARAFLAARGVQPDHRRAQKRRQSGYAGRTPRGTAID